MYIKTPINFSRYANKANAFTTADEAVVKAPFFCQEIPMKSIRNTPVNG